MDGLRSILADDHLKAELLTDTGDIQEVPLEKWRARDAGAIMETGFAKFHVWHGYTSANYEGVVLIDRNALAQALSGENVGQGVASPSSIDPELHPYLALMLKAAGELPFSKVDRLPKKEIEAWLRAKWPTDLGQPTDNKIESMATLLRRPEDEGGGNLPSKRNKGPDQ